VQWLGSSQHSCVSEPSHCIHIRKKSYTPPLSLNQTAPKFGPTKCINYIGRYNP